MGKNDNSTTDQKHIEGRWLSVEEIAAYLGVSKDSVYRWIDQGLPAHKLGRLWKFKATEVDNWVKSEKGKGK
jgi:excisionase family DNA binding protein